MLARNLEHPYPSTPKKIMRISSLYDKLVRILNEIFIIPVNIYFSCPMYTAILLLPQNTSNRICA